MARIQEISAVKSATDAPARPTIPKVDGLDSQAAVLLLENTFASGGLVYNKGYHHLCADMYESVARSLITSEMMPMSSRGLACAGLSFQTDSADTKAWALRRAFDAIVADAKGHSRAMQGHYPSEVRGSWLAVEATSACVSTITSGVLPSTSVVGAANSPTDKMFASEAPVGSDTHSEKQGEDDDGDMPVWAICALVGAGLVVIVLLAVIVKLLLQRQKSPKCLTPTQVVVGKPVDSTGKAMDCDVVMGA
jgi:hypothetical protein